MKYKYFIICFLLVYILLIINFVSSNGLVINNNNLSIIQSYNTTQTTIISITNTEPVKFYNISIEDNPYLTFSKISELDSGQTINFTANVIGSNDFNGLLRIRGYYLNNIGVQNKTYNINITYPEGVDKCSLTIIRGDRVIFQSFVNDDIKMKNEDTQQIFTTIPSLSSYTINFDNPQTLDYSVYRIGFAFGSICRITALNDVGYVNDPLLDSFLNIDFKMSYPSTSLNLTMYNFNYTIEFYKTTQDVLTLRNTGSNIARNITLNSDWFTFSPNNFNLDINENKVIIYTISPKIYDTNSTNQTHLKIINIKGNFNTINNDVSIFIPFANINSAQVNVSNSSSFLDYICSQRPDLCTPQQIVIYKTVGNTTQEFNVTMSQDQVNQIWQKIFSESDARKLVEDWLKEQALNNTQSSNDIKGGVNELKNQFNTIQTEQNKNNNFWFFFYIIISLIFIGGLIGFIGLIFIKQKNAKKKEIM